MLVQRIAAVSILLSILVPGSRPAAGDMRLAGREISGDNADSFRERGVLLMTADPGLIAMPAGYSRLDFQFTGPEEKSAARYILEDCIISAVIDGETISPVSAEQLDDVNFDDDLLSAFEQYHIEAVVRRIDAWVPGEIEPGVLSASFDLSRYYELYFPESLLVEDVVAGMEQVVSPDNVSTKPVPIVCSPVDPNPPLNYPTCDWWDDSTGGQWQLDSCGVFDAWDMICPSAGDNVVVAIIDEGFGIPPDVDLRQGFHPDIITNIHEKSRVNWDAGYTSDHGTGVVGVGFALENNGLPPAPSHSCRKPTDEAITDTYGTIGIAPHAKVIVLSYQDGSDYCDDLQYVLDSCPEVRVISFSWGIRHPDCIFPPHPDPLFEAQIEIAYKRGIALFASAGNSDMLCSSPYLQFPAASPFVHAVGATDRYGNRWVDNTGHASNYAYQGYVELAAPGDSILVPGPPNAFKPPLYRDTSIHYFHYGSGTSLSAPQAAATAALLMSAYPDIGSATVFDIMTRTTQEEYDEPDIYKGYGIVRADKALQYIAEVGLYHDSVYGDVDANGFVNFDDVQYLSKYIFSGGPAPVICDTVDQEIVYPLADANGDCAVNIGDIEYIMEYIFNNGPAPAAFCANSDKHGIVDKPGMINISNYPNPFNPMTRICYTLPSETAVRLDIYNILGQLVTTLLEKRQGPGSYEIVWDGRDESGRQVSSGIYVYTLTIDGFSDTKKMVLLK